MRRLLNSSRGALFIFLAGASVASAAQISAANAPKATPRLLRELARGSAELRVIIGVADGTPSPRAQLLHRDATGEPARRERRLAAQKSLAGDFSEQDFRPSRFYESFSMMAGTASPAAAIALANRSDVAWVTVDGTKRLFQLTPQSAQLLINSDQTNGRGFTGAGQAIAVIDTGVDYTISTLGGGGFPNVKVIGGTDLGDKDSDPMDCDGHGTDVAGVIAGPTGVAPDAKIVAIKVFPSQDPANGSCKEEANDSDIIAGIDYSVTNRTTFGITVLNLSLGGSFGDGADHGYCDSEEVAYATAIDSATAAGIVVAVAAGNDGTTNALSVPACISSAVSVGAVYPDSHTHVAWSDGNGGTQCTDQPAVPDQITCFSNSSTTLSLLAPGAFWHVASKGGSLDTFHGTSASTPSVAGAVALLKEARPDLSAAGLIGVLRSTGRPILDTRNNITTPRLDTLASVQLPASQFAFFTGAPVPIPDGTGSATATATISGFTGVIANVQAWAEIDHADPKELRLTLIGPDGTSAVLQDGTGQTEHPINAIYGKTDLPVQSLGAFAGMQGNGTWTLRVEDKVAAAGITGHTGRIRSFAVTLVPVVAAAPIVRGAPREEQPIALPFR